MIKLNEMIKTRIQLIETRCARLGFSNLSRSSRSSDLDHFEKNMIQFNRIKISKILFKLQFKSDEVFAHQILFLGHQGDSVYMVTPHTNQSLILHFHRIHFHIKLLFTELHVELSPVVAENNSPALLEVQTSAVQHCYEMKFKGMGKVLQ